MHFVALRSTTTTWQQTKIMKYLKIFHQYKCDGKTRHEKASNNMATTMEKASGKTGVLGMGNGWRWGNPQKETRANVCFSLSFVLWPGKGVECLHRSANRTPTITIGKNLNLHFAQNCKRYSAPRLSSFVHSHISTSCGRKCRVIKAKRSSLGLV